MAVETTKSRRDRLSMGHLLEKKYAAGAACADGAKTRGPPALFPELAIAHGTVAAACLPVRHVPSPSRSRIYPASADLKGRTRASPRSVRERAHEKAHNGVRVRGTPHPISPASVPSCPLPQPKSDSSDFGHLLKVPELGQARVRVGEGTSGRNAPADATVTSA